MNDLSRHSEFSAAIAASWDRCRSFGLSHSTRPTPLHLDNSARDQLREQNRLLVETTECEVLPYYENILSNTKCMILLTDNQGRILDNWGDRRFIEAERKAFFREGTSWQERINGTNAIGTTIACGHAIQVQRNEHYLKANRFMIGSAAPIFDVRQNLIGVLNVSSDTYMPQAHTLGMVRLMSQSVENRLMIRRFGQTCYLLTFNTNSDNLDSQWSGLIAFDETGQVVAANRRAQQLLEMPARGGTVNSVLENGHEALLQQPELVTLPIRSVSKRSLFGQVRRPSSAQTHIPVARPALPPSGPETPSSEEPAPLSLNDIEFGDPVMNRCIRQASRVMDREIPILIHGETGVGKEVLVKALHQASRRQAFPMVAVNCAAIPAELVESELFGYEKGAFTGASSSGAIGLIRKAHQGVLFLDEIGEMPLSAQARLLRVLQEREVTPLGSTERYPVDIRLISATNQPLKQHVSDGLFRADLYYRVSGLNIELPPLRHRADRRELFRRLHARLCAADQRHPLPEPIVDVFDRHPWPGNIRQLITVIQVALAMADTSPVEMWHLPDDFIQDLEDPGRPDALTVGDGVRQSDDDSGDPSDTFLTIYNGYQGNVSRTARHLGVSRNTVYKRLREIGIR